MRRPHWPYQAEIIDKVGGIVADVRRQKDSALEHYQKALKLNPFRHCPDRVRERAHPARGQGPHGRGRVAHQEAAAMKPADAMERLDVELARSELE
jgi:hypothetical protein